MYDSVARLPLFKNILGNTRDSDRYFVQFFIKVKNSTVQSFGMDRTSRYNDFEWAINPNRLVLTIFGLWPSEKRKMCKIVGSELRVLYHFITILFILFIPALVSLIRVWGNMILMIDNLQYSLTILMAIFKICIIWYKREALEKLIAMMERDWVKLKIKEERDVMLRCAMITRTLAICGAFMMILGALFSFTFLCLGWTARYVTNLTDPGKPLLIQSYYLHDVSKSPQYELTIIAQTIMTFTTGLSYSAVDNLLGLLVIHVCGQLTNLHSRLTHMGKYINFYAALKYNVQDHIRLIRSIQIINEIFDSMLLGLILYFGILFCLQGFLVLNVIEGKGQLSLTKLGWLFVAIVLALLHTCLYCAVGEFLTTQSEGIHRATYEYAWYTIESKAARNITLIMLRASKPLYITAGKTFPMTMATFCNLLKTSAGYISVLLANQN